MARSVASDSTPAASASRNGGASGVMLTCSSVRAAPFRLAHGEPADTDRDFAPSMTPGRDDPGAVGRVGWSAGLGGFRGSGGAQLAREGERHVLLDRLDLLHVAE